VLASHRYLSSQPKSKKPTSTATQPAINDIQQQVMQIANANSQRPLGEALASVADYFDYTRRSEPSDVIRAIHELPQS
jgi:hypothetical protein